MHKQHLNSLWAYRYNNLKKIEEVKVSMKWFPTK